MDDNNELKVPQYRRRGSWVQTERSAHEAWAALILHKPKAAALLHQLVSQMGEFNAVIIPQKMLAKQIGCSVRTIQTALRDLQASNWIQIVRIGKGKECAYVVNSRVAWQDNRDKMRISIFHATVIADYEDQDPLQIDTNSELRQIPSLYPDEIPLPSGEGEPPPNQLYIEGLAPDMPHLKKK